MNKKKIKKLINESLSKVGVVDDSFLKVKKKDLKKKVVPKEENYFGIYTEVITVDCAESLYYKVSDDTSDYCSNWIVDYFEFTPVMENGKVALYEGNCVASRKPIHVMTLIPDYQIVNSDLYACNVLLSDNDGTITPYILEADIYSGNVSFYEVDVEDLFGIGEQGTKINIIKQKNGKDNHPF